MSGQMIELEKQKNYLIAWGAQKMIYEQLIYFKNLINSANDGRRLDDLSQARTRANGLFIKPVLAIFNFKGSHAQ